MVSAAVTAATSPEEVSTQQAALIRP